MTIETGAVDQAAFEHLQSEIRRLEAERDGLADALQTLQNMANQRHAPPDVTLYQKFDQLILTLSRDAQALTSIATHLERIANTLQSALENSA